MKVKTVFINDFVACSARQRNDVRDLLSKKRGYQPPARGGRGSATLLSRSGSRRGGSEAVSEARLGGGDGLEVPFARAVWYRLELDA